MANKGSGTLNAYGTYNNTNRYVTVNISVINNEISYTIRSYRTTSQQPKTRITLRYRYGTENWSSPFYDSEYKGIGTFPSVGDQTISGTYTLDTSSGQFQVRLGVGIGHDNDSDAVDEIVIDRVDDTPPPPPTPTAYFDLNIFLPDGSQPWETGEAGYIKFSSDGGAAYNRVCNEPNPGLYYTVGTVFKFKDFEPGKGLHLDHTEGVIDLGGGVYGATLESDGLNANFYTAWNTYTVSFDANGGLIPDDGAMASHNTESGLETGLNEDRTSGYVTATYNSANYYSISEDIPTRKGYAFLGWYDAENRIVYDDNGLRVLDSSNNWYWGNQGYWSHEGNVELHAEWTPIQYCITFDCNGGDYLPYESEILTYEQSINCNIPQCSPTRKSYAFLGWYSSPTDGVQIYNKNGLCTNEGTYWNDNLCVYSGDYTVYAHWKPLNIAYYKLDGEWHLCNTYVKTDDTWKPAIMYLKSNNIYIR